MLQAHSPVIIDNTATELWEMRPYCALASEYSYKVIVIVPTTTWAWNIAVLAKKNRHFVPKFKLKQMRERFQSRDITGDALMNYFKFVNKTPLLRSVPVYSKPPSRFLEGSRSQTVTDDPDVVECATMTGSENFGMLETLTAKNTFVSVGSMCTTQTGHFEKNTMTDTEVTEQHESSFTTLRQMFENIPIEYIRDVFEKCGGDFDWSLEILLSGKYEPIADAKEPIKTGVKRQSDIKEEVVKLARQSSSSECTASTSGGHSDFKQDSDNSTSDDYKSEDSSAQMRAQNKIVSEDEAFARKLHQEEIKRIQSDQTPNLREIMAQQAEISRQQAVNDCWRDYTPDNLSYKLTMQKLIECYPQIGPDVLQEMLHAHNNSYEETVASIQLSDIEPAVPQATVLEAPYDEETLREAIEDFYLTVPDSELTYREQARCCIDIRAKLMDKARRYSDKRNAGVASYYSELARAQTAQIDKLNHLAANEILASNFEQLNDLNVLDLHRLHVKEAIIALDVFLDEHIYNLQQDHTAYTNVQIITGRGLHSAYNQPRIKPAVHLRLQNRGLNFYTINPGMVGVELYANSYCSTDVP